MLDMLEGRLREVAHSRDEFQRLINTREKQEEWFLSELILTLHERGVVPAAGQCYAFEVPPVLGGKMGADNVEVLDIYVWVSICGQIHRQVRALPPGTKISEFKTDSE
jgi:hypothetical protein